MAIMAIIMSLSLVAFKDLGRGAGMRGAVLAMKSNLSLARQNAITRREPIDLRWRNVFDPLNPIKPLRGMFYITKSGVLLGTTNFLSLGVVFPNLPGFEDNIRFKTDGSCDDGMSSISFVNGRYTIKLLETGSQGITNELMVYKRTGRVKVFGVAN